MRISDWSSDVCSSDLGREPATRTGRDLGRLAPGPGYSAAAGSRAVLPAVQPASAGGFGPPVAQSSSSTVCSTGVPAPDAIWVMQPTLPVATATAAVRSMFAPLRSRRRVAPAGLGLLLVPARHDPERSSAPSV